jgi:hypothetical protein
MKTCDCVMPDSIRIGGMTGWRAGAAKSEIVTYLREAAPMS